MLPSRLAVSARPTRLYAITFRALSTPAPPSGPPQPYRHEKPPPPPQTWLTRQLKKSPTAMRLFLNIFGSLGYGYSKQIAARRSLMMYKELCAPKAEEEEEFWRNECHLPPTFQSWFTITNLHVWILTTRLRALPSPHGQEHIQGLIDHFFLDVDERIRQVLQPLPPPSSKSVSKGSTSEEVFYTKPVKRGRAPEALVTKQMKIFREQWAGLGMACDLALVHGDAQLAGAIWRNLLGARGANGIAYSTSTESEAASAPSFRRAINPGGEVEKYSKYSSDAIQRLEMRNDGSGVHDFAPEDADRYLRYPETMERLVTYVRKEVVRLSRVSDDEIMGGDSKSRFGKEGKGVENLKFGKVSEL